MPIDAGTSILKTQLEQAFKMAQAAKPDIASIMIATALASFCSLGLFPASPPIPLVPAGFSACQNMVKQGFSMGQASSKSNSANMMSNGLSLIAPIAPPAGLSVAKMLMEQAFSLSQAATPSVAAEMLSQACLLYYKSGGIQ